MRLDLWLRNSGLIPRRTVAKKACDEGLVDVGGRPAKASHEVRMGDEVTVRIGLRVTTYRIEALPQRPVAKAERDKTVMVLETHKTGLEA